MGEVTVSEPCDHGDDVVNRVERGETVLVTRAGVPVGELRPLPGLTADALLSRWRHVPAVAPAAFRADLDAVLDPTL